MPSANGQETGWMMRCNVRWADDPGLHLKRPALERFSKPDSPVIETLVVRRERKDR